MNRPENFIETITTIEFKIFDTNQSTFVYDANVEQSCNVLWKQFSTAVIKKMTIFKIKTGEAIHIDNSEISKIKNNHLQGVEEDLIEHTKKVANLKEKYK